MANLTQAILLEYPALQNEMTPEYWMRLTRFSDTYWNTTPRPKMQAPYIMADGGVSIHTDWKYDTNVQMADYRTMVTPRLSVTPKADISANWERVGNHFVFGVRLTNKSGVSLSGGPGSDPGGLNDARVWALVYEDVTPDVSPTNPGPETIFHTNRYVRGLVQQPIVTELPNEGIVSLTLTTPDLTDFTRYKNRPINFNNLHGLVFVDYRPAGLNYEILQTVQASFMRTEQTSLTFVEDRAKPLNPTRTITFTGFPADLTWQVDTSDLPAWLKLNRTSGALTDSITASLDISKLAIGEYDSVIKISAVQNTDLTLTVPVHLSLAESLKYYWQPVIGKVK